MSNESVHRKCQAPKKPTRKPARQNGCVLPLGGSLGVTYLISLAKRHCWRVATQPSDKPRRGYLAFMRDKGGKETLIFKRGREGRWGEEGWGVVGIEDEANKGNTTWMRVNWGNVEKLFLHTIPDQALSQDKLKALTDGVSKATI